MLRVALLSFGLLALLGLVWHVGPSRILAAVSGLGPLILVALLVPSLVMHLLETLSWRMILGQRGRGVPFLRLLAIRLAGESVSMTTPTAYLGGEPLKAYMLQRRGVPLVKGFASVVLAKTLMTIAEMVFVLIGAGVGFWVLGSAASTRWLGLASLVGLGVLALALGMFLIVQRRGLFLSLLGVLRACRIRIGWLERREDAIRDIDRAILSFYIDDRRTFLLASLVFLLAWMVEGLEVFAILYCLDVPVALATSLSIAALSVLIKGTTFFIPGSLGAQEGGNLALLLVFGYSDLTGITFALLRRLRELAWIGIGLACLALLGEARGLAVRGQWRQKSANEPTP